MRVLHSFAPTARPPVPSDSRYKTTSAHRCSVPSAYRAPWGPYVYVFVQSLLAWSSCSLGASSVIPPTPSRQLQDCTRPGTPPQVSAVKILLKSQITTRSPRRVGVYRTSFSPCWSTSQLVLPAVLERIISALCARSKCSPHIQAKQCLGPRELPLAPTHLVINAAELIEFRAPLRCRRGSVPAHRNKYKPEPFGSVCLALAPSYRRVQTHLKRWTRFARPHPGYLHLISCV